jgi:hypothetical protein
LTNETSEKTVGKLVSCIRGKPNNLASIHRDMANDWVQNFNITGKIFLANSKKDFYKELESQVGNKEDGNTENGEKSQQ